MAAAFRSAGALVEGNSVSTVTVNYTLTAGDLLLVGIEAAAASTPTISSVLWNGAEAMTLVGVNSVSTFRNTYIYALFGATSGAHSVVVTTAGSCNVLAAVPWGISGAAGTWSGVGNGGDGSNNTMTASATGVGATDLVVSFSQIFVAATTVAMTAGTSQDQQTSANLRTLIATNTGSGTVAISGTLTGVGGWSEVVVAIPVPATTVAVTDSNIQFSPYNWYSDGAGALQANNIKGSSTYAITNNLGAYLKFKVTLATTGTVKLNVDTTSLATLTAAKCPTLYYAVDGASFTSALLASGQTQVTLGSLSAGTYTFYVYFKSVGGSLDADDVIWSVPKLAVTVTGLSIPTDASMAAPTVYSKNMIVYGDSHVAGFGNVAGGTLNAANDATQAWGILLGFGMDAEVGVLAYGGQGYVKGINNVTVGSTTPALYHSTDANQSWNKYYSGKSRLVSSLFSPAPDYVFVIHGQNDASLLSTPVTNAIDAIRGACPSTTWIFISANVSGTNGNAAAISTGKDNAATQAKTAYLAPTVLFTAGAAAGRWNPDTSSHPSLYGHAVSNGEIIQLAQAKIIAAGGTAGVMYRNGMQGNVG